MGRSTSIEAVEPQRGKLGRAGVGLIRLEVNEGRATVDSPVPVRFVAADGSETTSGAGLSEFHL